MKKPLVIHMVPFLSYGGAEKVAALLAYKGGKFAQRILMFYNKQTYETSAPVDKFTGLGFLTTHKVFYKQYGIIRKIHKALIAFLYSIFLYRYLVKKKPDLIVIHSEVIRRILVLSFYLNKVLGLIKRWPKIVVVLHSATFVTSSFRRLFPDALYIAPSVGIKGYYEYKHPDLRNKIRVIPNPYDPRIISLAQKSIDAEHVSVFRRARESLKLINIGALTFGKAQWHFIRGVWYLNKILRIDTHGFILGADGGLARQLKQLVQDLGISSRLHFLGFQPNPYRFLRRMDIFWFTTLSEVLPLVLLESMVLKVPVVSTDVVTGPREILGYSTDYSELLRDRFVVTKYGILTPAMEDKFLTTEPLTPTEKLNIEAIVKLYRDKKLYESIRENAYTYAKKEYSIRKVRRLYDSYFEEVLEGGGVSRDKV